MHVVHVITNLARGGAEMMLLKIVQGRSPDILHTVVSLQYEGTLGASFADAGVRVVPMSLAGGKIPGLGALRLVSQLRSLNPNVVQGWMYHGNLASAFGRCTTLRSVPLIWSIRCSLNKETESNFTRAVIDWGARLSSLPKVIIYNSERARSQHEAAGYRADRGVVIPNGFDLRRFSPALEKGTKVRKRLGIGIEKRVVGLVARLHPVKDHATFLKAAAIVVEAHPDAIFVAAGRDVPKIGNRLPDFASIVSALGSKLILCNEQDDVSAFMNALDLCVLCSRAEGFPNVLGEAMACGVPCVATDVGDCGEIIGDTGLVTASSSAPELANAICRILALSAGERSALGVRARRRVEEKYSIEHVVRNYESIWRAGAEPGFICPSSTR